MAHRKSVTEKEIEAWDLYAAAAMLLSLRENKPMGLSSQIRQLIMRTRCCFAGEKNCLNFGTKAKHKKSPAIALGFLDLEPTWPSTTKWP
ncbi:hypothetical protein [Pseudomonas prosekii]|uniref:hypothetical protein n=1 Tax=Pseudomonas prosekii TaxID=1148509 RepID=UPI0011EAEBD9|nr:hypothetical protein [Pseudomonas prosekii]